CGAKEMLSKCAEGVPELLRMQQQAEDLALIQNERQIAEGQARTINAIKGQISQDFAEGIFDIDYKVVLSRYHEAYSSLTNALQENYYPAGEADVIVTEAFVGNVILKLYEGLGSTLLSKVKEGLMSSLRSKIGALLIKPALKTTLKSFDASQYGGAPLLGLKGLVVKCHGNSKALEVHNSIIQCVTFKEQQINEKIRASLGTE